MARSQVRHPRGRHLHHPRLSGHLPEWQIPVTDHHPATVGVHHLGVGVQIGAPLCLQRDRQHLLGGQTTQIVEIGRACRLNGPLHDQIISYLEHRRTPPRRHQPAIVSSDIRRVRRVPPSNPSSTTRGRDTGCPAPPAQIPAGAANALGSCLGCWRRSGRWARDAGCGLEAAIGRRYD